MARKGIPRTEEVKNKLSIALMGHEISTETRNKISETLKGRHLSNETKEKLSKSLKGKKHKSHPLHLSDEHKLKLSLIQTGKKRGPYKKKTVDGATTTTEVEKPAEQINS